MSVRSRKHYAMLHHVYNVLTKKIKMYIYEGCDNHSWYIQFLWKGLDGLNFL